MLRERAAQAVELATRAGAQDAWGTASKERSVEVEYRDDILEKVQESTTRGLAIRLWVDGRYSTHRTTDLRPASLARFIPEAVALTRALEEDPFREITPPELYADRPSDALDLVSAAVGRIEPQQRTDWCREMVEAARAHERIISATVGVSTSERMFAAASSNGFTGSRASTSVWCGGEVTLRGEGERRPEGYYWAGSTHLDAVPARAEIGRLALREAQRRLGSTKGPTARTTMVVEPRAAGHLLRRLLGPATARAFSQERSFFLGRVGQQVASETLSLVDDPLLRRGFASRHFDGEGIRSRRLPILEGGVLRNIYVDTYYGRKIGLQPTTGSRSNLEVPGGEKGLDALISDAGRGVLVTSWLGGNADATTGDFSFGLRGHLIEGGRAGAPVGEMNVTGNLLELFGQLGAIGNDPWPYSSVRAPTLVFENVQFSGADA
ncbi:MAG: TldD/PmbA family protein [Myxococcota bacterium]